MHGDEIKVVLFLRPDSDDLERLGDYQLEGMTMQDALVQLAQDRLGPDGAQVLEAEWVRR